MEGIPRKKVITLVVLVLLVVVIIALWKEARFYNMKPDQKLYQVVLLSNDQAFYGKLHSVDSPYPYLTDVYYLNPQQPGAKDVDTAPKYTVVKRGIDEIHAPTDKMYVQKTNILYWENVGPESKVARGIKADQDMRAKQAAQVK